MGGACSTNREKEEHIEAVGGKSKRKENSRMTKT
jgi:hypothetical protein